ncbi:histidine kinase dimerization/phosphoacceptor domain-containing protein [Streptomyces scabiei]|uniref:histidine kinase dimerization/phosphoacceptor domain-containing protein n=1 Tax=Streptomyces scabiei TaxID=1930 RepID=UPI0027E20F17|nr:histidine kinase dimerization/phosphoacceptor domain-containing protein [Streptomyces sp. LBUM 1486]
MNLVLDSDEPAEDAGPRARPARAGCVRGGGIVALYLACLSDFLLLATDADSGSPWLHLFSLAAGLLALLWPERRRPAWVTPQVRAGVPALAALTNVVVLVLARDSGGFGVGQAALLVCALVVAVRTCTPGWALACGLLDGLTLGMLTLPYFVLRPDDSANVGAALLLFLLGGVAAGVAAYLRTLDNRRNRIVTETRRAERLAMAADLHDFVAHHVTGILVQSQVARMMAGTESQRSETGVPRTKSGGGSTPSSRASSGPRPRRWPRCAARSASCATTGRRRRPATGGRSGTWRASTNWCAASTESAGSTGTPPCCATTPPSPPTCRTRCRPPPSAWCRRP